VHDSQAPPFSEENNKMLMKYTRSITPLLALALFAGACSTKDNNADTLAVDTALNRDLALANSDSAAQAQLKDVPSGTSTTKARTGTTSGTSAPRTSTTTTKTTTTSSGNKVTTGGSGAGGAVGTLPSGTSMSLSSNSRVCTNTHKVGDTFTATVNNPVSAGGVTVPAGSTVRLEVVALKRSENANDPITMTFRVQSISINGKSYPIDGTVNTAQVDRVRNQSKGKDAQKVATGAAIGAIAGQILGKNTKSTVIGGAVGAAAGTAAAVGTANYEGCVPLGGNIAITTNAPAQIRL
jgi:hypothetical protein